MAVREFNGIADSMSVDNGVSTVWNSSTPCSWLGLVHCLSTAGTRAFGGANFAGGSLGSLYTQGTNLVWGDDVPGQDMGSAGVFGGITDQTTSWILVGMDVPGTVGQTARFHAAVLGGAWTHGNSSNTGTVNAGGLASFSFLSFGGTAGAWNARIAVAAAWPTTRLTDANYESIGLSTASIAALSPTHLWEFNQAAVSTPVTDLMGNGADENVGSGARNGTTVVTTDDPPGWTFGLAPPPAAPPFIIPFRQF